MKKSGKENQNNTLRVSVVAAVLGAIAGSLITFLLPHVWNYFTSPQTPPAPPATLNTTPDELLAWHKKINQDVQAQSLAKDQYYGKWVRWTGTIEDIHAFPAFKATLACEKFSAFCNPDDVQTLTVGARVTILGRIVHISDNVVLLDDCKVQKIHQETTQ
jgi:hypothetical protein